MLKLIKPTPKDADIITMGEMQPYDVGVIISELYGGEIVMRTASTREFEVMNLSTPSKDRCWLSANTIEVKLFKPGTRITLEVI